MRNLFFCCLVIWCQFSFGLTNKSCISAKLKIDHKNLVFLLPEKKINQVYFIHNRSKQSLWIDHPAEKKGMSAGWSSYLRVGKWSALLLNRNNFVITCATIEPGKVNYRDCSKNIEVCTIPKLTFESKRKGTYWLIEDKDWEGLMTAFANKS